MSDFNGKIVIKKVVNGEPHIIERSFDNQQDYDQFVQDNNLDLNWGVDYNPMMGRWGLWDDMLERFARPAVAYHAPMYQLAPTKTGNQILDKYSNKQYELRNKKLKNQKEIQELKKTISELQRMQKEFEADWDQATVWEIIADIQEMQEKLKSLE